MFILPIVQVLNMLLNAVVVEVVAEMLEMLVFVDSC